MKLVFFCIFAICSLHASFFQAKSSQPYHLSVGAVLFNEEGKVACHHFENLFGFVDLYILMRETMEDGETIFDTLERGLMEEFGAEAKPLAFLGSLSGYLPSTGLSFDKTTLYIACKVKTFNPSKRDPDDPEAFSQIEWLDPEILIARMEAQGFWIDRCDVDESSMIKRALPFIRSQVQKAE